MIRILKSDLSLHEAESEDVTFLAFQLWLFGMALMTVSGGTVVLIKGPLSNPKVSWQVLNESIPHL